MIARCPECQTRYRLAREKLGLKGARIRCSRCETVFRVKPPADEEDASEPALKRAPMPQVDASSSSTPASSAVDSQPTPPAVEMRWRAVVAEADEDAAKSIVEFLREWGIDADPIPDGGEALLRIHRKPPDLVVLGGHLPGLNAPAVVEILRRNPQLAALKVIRIAPMDEPAGIPEFEAHHMLEPGDLCSGLASPLRDLGLGVEPTPQSPPPPEPAPEPAPIPPVAEAVPESPKAPAPQLRAPNFPVVDAPPAPEVQVVAPPPPASPLAPQAAADDPEVAKAERLARIIVSDIILYNEEKFAAAVASGAVATALSAELSEASQLFEQRVPETIRSGRNFLVEELERRAEKYAP